MATEYPDSLDTFNEPTLPEETPLASAGTATRNHIEHHRDLGDAIEKMQAEVAKKGHDHSGGGGTSHGPKLTQAQTHESPDTDQNNAALHHTLGTGQYQAAKGNHSHAYSDLSGLPLIPCTSDTRPTTPTPGLLIYELDTFRLRSWSQYPGDSQLYWKLLLGPTPVVRLRQSANQQLSPSGSVIEWHQELEDTSQMFNGGVSRTDIVCTEPGLYQIDVGVQWDPHLVPDIANIVVTIDGQRTSLFQSQYMRGNLFTPGFSQTISTSGKLRLGLGQVVRLLAYFTPTNNIFDQIFSHWDPADNINSRIDMAFIPG